jgi:hypothetical protein
MYFSTAEQSQGNCCISRLLTVQTFLDLRVGSLIFKLPLLAAIWLRLLERKVAANIHQCRCDSARRNVMGWMTPTSCAQIYPGPHCGCIPCVAQYCVSAYPRSRIRSVWSGIMRRKGAKKKQILGVRVTRQRVAQDRPMSVTNHSVSNGQVQKRRLLLRSACTNP